MEERAWTCECSHSYLLLLSVVVVVLLASSLPSLPSPLSVDLFGAQRLDEFTVVNNKTGREQDATPDTRRPA
jgi:hypothetical protein